MFDIIRIQTLLERIESAILLIQNKAQQISNPTDFLLDQEGTFLLSGICMQLIFIGESIKTIDNKTSHCYLTNYPDTPWNHIMGLRDIIAHEYHKIDEEEIFNIIKSDLPSLLSTIRQMKKELPNYL
ncbi:HepT-like ribonuclease domain-containing protein [uncultured Parabacteroides sp.]|uniref:HepT-like ribonuclease domain-containing protein n=1 Tax=uncultured Parabacteroides sp. TaxID=512312 RepID=UPI002806157E|nr:HepT-like ribonuclease domain-containing protein [uncultured Parabacteroides sp.]